MSKIEPLPEYDMDLWLRCCEEHTDKPVQGTVTGNVPSWLSGSLFRNGPGTIKMGSSEFGHIFDGSALLHRFGIKNGSVTYQCRFLNSETLKKNKQANRIVVNEFASKSVPDPCHTIFQRIASIFKVDREITDNAGVSVHPFGDQIYAMTEVPNMYRIDKESLETLEKKSLIDALIVCHTAHPHVMSNGDVYNVGMQVVKGMPKHVIVKIPFLEKEDMFESVEVVSTIEPKWRFNPAYMHSFGITENYFIIIEQPLSISILYFIRNVIIKETFSSTLTWYPEYEVKIGIQTHIILVHRKTGEQKRYRTDTFFFMHLINSYEKDGKLFIDVCTYKDAKIIDAMYVEAIKMTDEPTKITCSKLYVDDVTDAASKLEIANCKMKLRFLTFLCINFRLVMLLLCIYYNYIRRRFIQNCNNIPDYGNWHYTRPKRIEIPLNAPADTKVPTGLIADVGVEAPRINYEVYNGRPYKYFYGIGSEITSEYAGSLIKIDTQSGAVTTWREIGCYPSEPVFVPHPDAKEEDDGVLLSALLWTKDDHAVTLLIINARDMQEVARAQFTTRSQAPKCFHGWNLYHMLKVQVTAIQTNFLYYHLQVIYLPNYNSHNLFWTEPIKQENINL